MELGHIAQKILDNFQGKLEDVSIIEKQPKREGRRGGCYHAKNEDT